MTGETTPGHPNCQMPRNRREARRWVRQHWASVIDSADMGGVGDLENDHLDEVWSDECARISRRLAAG